MHVILIRTLGLLLSDNLKHFNEKMYETPAQRQAPFMLSTSSISLCYYMIVFYYIDNKYLIVSISSVTLH